MIKMTPKQYEVIKAARDSKNREKTLAKFYGNNWFDSGWPVNLLDVITAFYDESKIEIAEKQTDES